MTQIPIFITRNRREKQNLFKKLGIPGPEPHLVYGNVKDFRVKGTKCAMKEWREKYSPLYGYYDGVKPHLVVSDPVLVQQITIRQFHKFHSRMPFALHPKGDPTEPMFFAIGEKWKRLRNVASPSFTHKKMKEMSPLINQSVDDFLTLLDRKCDERQPFDIYSEFGRLTTDVISSCAFGIDAGCLKDPNSPFLVQARKHFDIIESFPIKFKIFMFLIMLFPDFIEKIRTIFPRFLTVLRCQWAYKMAREVILERQTSQDKDRRVDFINLMLTTNKEVGKGAIKAEQQEKDDYDRDGFLDTDVNQLRKNKPMILEEMMGQVVIFLNAGYETTSSALGFTAYELALNPSIQKKLQQEIDDNFPAENPKPTFGDFHKMKYIECVMKEVLRIHPIAPGGVTRHSFEQMIYEGITIPKGMDIHIDMEGLHFNPELWGKYDPQKFVPERFLEDCQDTPNTLAWCPFGAGPRICLGMRFAVMEYKIALTRLLKQFNIKRCNETKVPCPTRKNAIYSPSEGVTIMLERRN